MAPTALQKTIALPLVSVATDEFVTSLTVALGVPREILASSEEIGIAWVQLPVLLNKIPANLRGPLLARMCVAVSVGLTDAAINYAWNTAIIELREKIRRFGVNVVPQITSKPFDEDKLTDLQDSEILSLCLELNLITEEGFFMLDQCRDIRNNFSAAHPTIGQVDAYEFINFLNRCAKFALSDLVNPKGVNTKAFILAIKGPKFEAIQKIEWSERLSATHDAQRDSLLLTLHGIYCDGSVSEEARLNALGLSEIFAPAFSAAIKSELIERHSVYRQNGDAARHTASQRFFGLLGLLDLLDDAEKHSLIVNASKRLMGVHQAYNNFYNEPPFAQRLAELTADVAVPVTAREEFVQTVVACAIGNPYGVSRDAVPYYEKMAKAFTPGELETIFVLLHRLNTLVPIRIKAFGPCRARLKALLQLIDPQSIPIKYKIEYDSYIQ
jgi:hypothetical protein